MTNDLTFLETCFASSTLPALPEAEMIPGTGSSPFLRSCDAFDPEADAFDAGAGAMGRGVLTPTTLLDLGPML
jgi:hypothetical protein